MWRLHTLRSCTASLVGGATVARFAARCEEEAFGDEFGLDENDKQMSALGIKPPGQFEQWDGDIRRLTHLQAFKGAKVDVSKPITPNFVLRHSIQLGESPSNPQANEHYSFMAQVFNDRGVMMGTLDQNGTVEAQVIVPSAWFIHKKLASKLILYFSGPNEMFWHDIEYTGPSYNTQMRWGNNVMGWQGKMAQASYTQAVSPTVMLGAEAGLMNGLLTPTCAGTFKVDRENDTWIGTVKTHAQPCGVGEDGQLEASAHYHRKVVKDRVNLAASLTTVPLAGQAQAAFGAEFQLHQSTVATSCVPGQGKVATVVSAKINQGMNLSFSAEAIFGQQNQQTGEKADSFRFGYGLSLG
mmetsp:Transcript_79805/g.159357  ORF Transcript_79805/g.159357 Transcript_79805/m.159357 type:complete len:354 (-) Transcript_79805:223-1284(-)